MISSKADLLKLTPRQREVLSLVAAHGMSKIGRALHIAEATTKIHTAGMLRALGARIRAEEANEMDGPCAVLVVDTSALFREGLTRIIANGKFRVAATLSSVEDLAAGSLPRNCPLLLVLGSRDEPATTAKEIKAFRQQCPDARIAVLAENHDIDDVVMSFRAGADAYLYKVACQNALIKSLELVMSGETLLTSAMLVRILDQQQERGEGDDQAVCSAPDAKAVSASEEDDIPHLSVRERIILGCLIAGNSNKVIARRIGAAEATVKAHVKSILRKIRLQNRTQAAIWASHHGYATESADASTLGVPRDCSMPLTVARIYRAQSDSKVAP